MYRSARWKPAAPGSSAVDRQEGNTPTRRYDTRLSANEKIAADPVDVRNSFFRRASLAWLIARDVSAGTQVTNLPCECYAPFCHTFGK